MCGFLFSSCHEQFEVDILETDEQKKYIDELEKVILPQVQE